MLQKHITVPIRYIWRNVYLLNNIHKHSVQHTNFNNYIHTTTYCFNINNNDNNETNSNNETKSTLTTTTFKSSFRDLPSLPLHTEYYNTAIKQSNKIHIGKRGKTGKQYILELNHKKLQCIHNNIYNRLYKIYQQFPDTNKLHPFECNIIELSLKQYKFDILYHSNNKLHNNQHIQQRNGVQHYNDILKLVKSYCNSLLSIYQQYSSMLNKQGHSIKAIEQIYNDAIDAYNNKWHNSNSITLYNSLKQLIKLCYNLPVFNPTQLTIALLGCPNVGKSSIVRMLSSVKPEIQNYSFTTRGIIVGHMYVNKYNNSNDDELYDYDIIQSQPYKVQITDTPGLLPRHDSKRKSIELLTLSVLKYMSTKPVILYITDLSQHCGYTVQQQLAVRYEIIKRYGDSIQLIDIVSKCDIEPYSVQVDDNMFDLSYLHEYANHANHSNDTHTTQQDNSYKFELPPNALYVSTLTGHNIDQLKQLLHQTVQQMLPSHDYDNIHNNHTTTHDSDSWSSDYASSNNSNQQFVVPY